MQIQSGQAVKRRESVIHDSKPPKTPVPKQGPVLASSQQADSLILFHSSKNSSSAPAASMPRFQDAGADAPALPPAVQEAIRRDDWTALSAAQDDRATATITGLSLMRHAALAGAARIVFRLQSQAGTPVSPFAPDVASCAFYAALKHGKGQVAKAMLDNYTVIERTALPDLRPYLEAAVDADDSKAISWLVEFSKQKKCVMPFELLNDAIRKPDPRQLETMVSHPAFTQVLNDTEAERMVLSYAVRKGAASTLQVLLARRRASGAATWLCTQTCRKGNTLLHRAAASGDPAKLALILDFNPDIRREGATDSFFDRLFRGDAINARNRDGKTALGVATDSGHMVLAGMLHARGGRL